MSATGACRILVCEDSLTYAEGLRRFLEHDADLEVVALCPTAEQALVRARELDPDLVIMDVELPGMDGVEATRLLTSERQVPVLILSAHHGRRSERAFAALAAGAADARPKSDLPLGDPTSARSVAFRRYVKRLAATRRRARRPPSRPPTAPPRRRGPIGVIGLAASTGGPPALGAVLESLARDFAIPVVIVQHIAPGFLDGLIRWLDSRVAIPVKMARDGLALGPGAWVAPDDAHLVVEDGLIARLDSQTVSGYHRPAADVLFASLASVAGAEAAAVVLTGMGSDGAEGAAAVKAGGGLTIAQDEPSSVVYGMPRAAAAQGVDHVLPLAAIGPALSRLTPLKHVA